MDSDPDWTATALFSPSKARIAQAQARDWGFIDTWLAKKYGGKRSPDFERNEETLQALLTLATANEGADEMTAAVAKVERAALPGLSGGGGDEVYRAIMGEMSEQGGESLDALAELDVVFDLGSGASAVEVGVAVADLQSEQFELEQQLRRVEDQKKALQRESNRLKALLRELKDDSLRAPPDLPEQTGDWMKNAKHLKAKISEYDERLAGLKAAGTFMPSVESVSQQTDQLLDQKQKLVGLEAELKAFQSLPTDARDAKAMMEKARDELRRLTMQRDRLFENMMHDG